jgi:hypothetical protein
MVTTALVMCLGDPSGDPRPKRMIELLTSEGFSVDVLSWQPKGPLQVNRHFIMISAPSSFRFKVKKRVIQVLSYNSRRLDHLYAIQIGAAPLEKQIWETRYSLLVVEDLAFLPFAEKVKNGGRIIFDAREYYPRQNEESLRFRLFEHPERMRLCRTFLPTCDHVITVSPGLAAEYKREFGIDSSVIMSVPNYSAISPRKTDKDNIRIVHHGIANPNRRLERMIDVVRMLPSNFSLDLYLTGSPACINFLKAYCQSETRIRIKDPVAFDTINTTLASYDIGLFYNEPKTFNLRHCLPNKLFEFIQARLVVAIGPSPDMAAIVRQYQCGVVADKFSAESMAKAIMSLTTNQIDELKQKSHFAAEELCFERERFKLVDIINSLVSCQPSNVGYI